MIMLDQVKQMRFITFVLIVGLTILLFFVFIRNGPNILHSERHFDFNQAANRRDVKTFKLKYVFQDVHVKITGRMAHPRHYDVGTEANYPPVLLLHDTKKHTFSSKIWERLGTIRFLTGYGHKVYAIDLPGFGGTRLQGHLTEAQFLSSLVEHLKIKHCILVIPGQSASYGYAFLMGAASQAKEHVVGVLAVGTPLAAEYSEHNFHHLSKYKVYYLQGANDKESGKIPLSRFKKLAHSKVRIIPRAGYYAYMDNPKQFHVIFAKLLLKFHP
jgi:hypothetical protein